jgi:hypothetical protein
MVVLMTLLALANPGAASVWEEDFAAQPISRRPRLEVRYTDNSRTMFEILAERYHLKGLFKGPRLLDFLSGDLWLALEVEDGEGRVHSTLWSEKADPSRINLYRRGPYFCEVHWLDVTVAREDGQTAPLKGDLALYCYPEKVLASINWHGVGSFDAKSLRVRGIAESTHIMTPFTKGATQFYAFPLFGETPPLPDSAFDAIEAVHPIRYDAVRGCYTIGSHSEGGFQGHFYHFPNFYETVHFRATNQGPARQIYVCHETLDGDKGSVEGGVLLDSEGHPLPITVQISKNFAGEKEEGFYNPQDTPFSETYFPLYLGENETCELSSLHLYQNWGRHRVKQFSSLGAWMDYFHSSTGVTETTCYVPFKFGGLPGVTIADYRAMSQPTFWGGQPQHDNIAGHSFLSYRTAPDAPWQYLVYRGTTYYSTGPNWMDIGLQYLSSDGKVKGTVETFELPQTDQLRNFIRVRYEALESLDIANPKEDFRLLTIASWVQHLRYTHFAATGAPPRKLDLSSDHFDVSGLALPPQNAFVTLYGESMGSNAIVLENWRTKGSGAAVGPAASVWCEKNGNTRLLLTANADKLSLGPGDTIEIDAYFFAYGDSTSALPADKESTYYGDKRPQIVSVATGEKVSDFPSTVRANDNEAEFTLQGGRDLVPVIVTGLTSYRYPRIYQKQSNGSWRLLSAARAGTLDGIQTYVEEDGRFGTVFLVASDAAPQQLRVSAGEKSATPPRIRVVPQRDPAQPWRHAALIQAPWMDAPVQFRYPETLNSDTLDFIDHKREDMPPRVDPANLANVWKTSEADSLWFEWDYDNQVIGGRLTPNEDTVDVEFWFGNKRSGPVRPLVQFCSTLTGTLFEDRSLERTWIYTKGAWTAMANTDRGAGNPALCHYPVEGSPAPGVATPWGCSSDVAEFGVVAVTSEDGRYVYAVAWPNSVSILSNTQIPCVHADPVLPECPAGRRAYVHGRLYMMEATLEDVLDRVRREVLPRRQP